MTVPLPDLVNVREAGVRTDSYYWTRRDYFGLTDEELAATGLTSDQIYVHPAVIEPLRQANTRLKEQGYEIVVHDGYRSPEFYKLIQQKRYRKHGKEHTDKLLNTERMPHATGRVVDINLVNLKTGQEAQLRNKAHDHLGNQFVGFHRDKPDAQSQRYQKLQDLMVGTMLEAGFTLGVKNEYWHFEFGLEH